MTDSTRVHKRILFFYMSLFFLFVLLVQETEPP